MTSPNALIKTIQSYNPNTQSDLILNAYRFAQEMHDGQFRRSGEPYYTHPVAVAKILADQQMDDATIITALLHDTIEDTKASYSDIKVRFGEDVAELVDGVTKLTNLQLSSSQTKEAENFRKLFIATSRDLRVTLVKLADRLHNMRTIASMIAAKQSQKSRETMDIYAPLAGRMGMQWMREELEDLAFEVLNPDARLSIMTRLDALQKEAGDAVERITYDIDDTLMQNGIDAEIMGREKRPYSIWRKMKEKDQPFARLSDILGFRIITKTESECYSALGVIHQRWRAIPGRFKDYISQPKANGYRSIQTTVSGRDARRVEVQIRTSEMHEVAESGVAAHWSYKDGAPVQNRFAVEPAKWISKISERLADEDDDDHDGFLEAVKLEMYNDQVFCFTPKGEVIQLPKGATPIDFAYAVHTRLGAKTVGAQIDGIRAPLWTRLKNGQSVSIITANGQRPQSAWLDIVTTGRAKSSIRRALRRLDKEKYTRLGRDLARTTFENKGKELTEKGLELAAQSLSLEDTGELLMQIGRAEISAHDVLHLLYPDLPQNDGPDIAHNCAVVGLEGEQPYHRAQCCQPIPGERIVGITFRGHGIVLHAIDCDVLGQYEDQMKRWIDLQWQEGRHQAIYGVSFDVTITNKEGVLGVICSEIGERGANISDLNFIERKPDYYRLIIDMDLRDTEHLHQITTALKAHSQVASITRQRNPKAAEYGLEQIDKP